MRLAATLLLFALIPRFGFADSPNLFDSSKMSTESLALGIETCANKIKGDKRQKLITRHYCACMMDVSQVLGPKEKLSKDHAQACLSHATEEVDQYLQGKRESKEQNLFDANSLPTSSIYTMYLVCRKRRASKARHCGCLIDAVRTDSSFTPEDFVSGRKPLRPDWIRACSGGDPGSAVPSRSKR
jgi:hypothetical protein